MVADSRTWLDVLPDHARPEPEQLITREELIRRVCRAGDQVSDRDLVFWESTGVLPRPVKRRRDGATKALYPHYALDAVIYLRNLQSKRRRLSDIAPLLWQFASHGGRMTTCWRCNGVGRVFAEAE